MNGSTALGTVIGFVLLGIVFGTLERVFRSGPGPGWWRRVGTRTDLLWFAFTALVGRAITTLGVGLAVIALVVLTGRSAADFQTSGAFVRTLPVGVQLLAGLLLADLIGYWTHRVFHGRRLWRIHAVHHSSTQLDWLSSVRTHPLNAVVGRTAGAVPLLVLGFDPLVFAVVAPFLTLYAVMLHANVDWTFGPLRTVIASPVFHRWHHTAEAEGFDKNFAGLFPIWDLVFGTYFMPGRAPTAFGTPNETIPPGFLGQLAYPFRR